MIIALTDIKSANKIALIKILGIELKEIGDSLDEVNSESDKEKLNKPLNKIARFLKKLGNEKSKYYKIISGAKNLFGTIKKVAKVYNNFASLLPIPKIPEVLLKD